MPQDKPGFSFYEHPLGDEQKYARALAAHFAGVIEFETGCGHIAHDLMARLPSIPEAETSKAVFCHVVAGMVSPLAACLFAKSIGLRISASSHPAPPPEIVAGIGTYSVFDLQSHTLRHCMLPPPEREAYESAFLIGSGVTVLCEPLNLTGQQFHDTTRDSAHNATDAVWDWTERMLRAWFDQAGKPFVPERLRMRTTTLVGQNVLGVVETAALATISAALGDVPTNFIPGRQPEQQRRMTTAFVHEAGHEETATHNKPKVKEPAPSDAHKTQEQHAHAALPHPDVS